MKGVLTATKIASGVTKAYTAIQTAFNAVLNANPFVLIISAIVGLVAALIYFFTQTETGQKIWKSFTKFLVDTWNSVKDKAVEIFNIADFIKNTWDSIVKTASGLK